MLHCNVFVLALALLACAAPVRRDGEWALASLPGAPANAPRPTLSIAGDRLSGFTGCNRVVGAIESDGNVAAFFRGSPAVTEMYCEANAAMEMERVFLEALERTGDARIEGGALVFFDVNNQEIMRFEAARR